MSKMKNAVTIEAVRRRAPDCCMSAIEACESDPGCSPLQNIIDGVQHELDLFEEGEFNITAQQASKCRAFLAWVKTQKIKDAE